MPRLKEMSVKCQVPLHVKMAMPESQRYPLKAKCLIKAELYIKVKVFKTDYFQWWFLYK